MSKVKVGVVGCGNAVNMFMTIARYLEHGQVVSLMDVDRAKLKQTADAYGIERTYDDYDQFLEKSGVDAVIIVVPHNFHAELTIKAARRGVHVLCEKPMAPTVGACTRMMKACSDNRVILMLGFMKRFDKSMLRAKELIDSGELGTVNQVITKWSSWGGERMGWRSKFQPSGGGVFLGHGSHVIDLCRWWLGDIDSVSAEVNVLGQDEVDNCVNVLCRHSSGAVSVHMQSKRTHCELTEYYLIDGSKASLELRFDKLWSYVSNDPFHMYLYRNGRHREDLTVRNDFNMDVEISRNNRYKNELDYFCRCVAQGTEPKTATPEDGLKAVEAINAAYLSSHTGQKIRLPLSPEHHDIDLAELFAAIKSKSPSFE